MKIFSIANLTLLSALFSACVSGAFSVLGMMTVFSGQPTIGILVGLATEFAKLMSVSWLYRNWKDKTWFRGIGLILTFVAMFVTSMGVFGQLSKAHTGDENKVDNNSAKVVLIDQKIQRLKAENADDQKMLDQLDEQVQKLINYDKISSKGGAKEVRASQKEERETLEKNIEENNDKIEKLEEQKFEFTQVVRDVNAELGPLKLMADIFYDKPEEHISFIVKLAICLIVIILDPMAIYLLMCYNHSVMKESLLPKPIEEIKKEEQTEPVIQEETKVQDSSPPEPEEDKTQSFVSEQEEIKVEEPFITVANEPIINLEYPKEEMEIIKKEPVVLNSQNTKFYDLDKDSIQRVMEETGLKDIEVCHFKFLKFGKDNFYYVVSYKDLELEKYHVIIIGIRVKYLGYEGLDIVPRRYTWPERVVEKTVFDTEEEAGIFIRDFKLPERLIKSEKP